MSDKYSSHGVYNGSHPSLEMSEEEFQQFEPANCELCGKEYQFKHLINVAITIEECIDICKECYDSVFLSLKSLAICVFEPDSYNELLDKAIKDMSKPPKGETIIYKRR